MLLRLPHATQAEAYRNSGLGGQGWEPISIITTTVSSSSSAARDSLEHCLTCLSKLSAGSTSRAAAPAAVVEKLQWHCGLGGQWLLVQVGDWLTHPQGWTGPAMACCRLVCVVVLAGLLAVLAALADSLAGGGAPNHICCRE